MRTANASAAPHHLALSNAELPAMLSTETSYRCISGQLSGLKCQAVRTPHSLVLCPVVRLMLEPTGLLSESSSTYAAPLARRCTPQWTMLEIYMSDTTGTNAASTKRATC